MNCGVDHRPGSDPVLLWLWCRPAATAPIQLLVWKPPYATGCSPKKKKKQTLKRKKKKQTLKKKKKKKPAKKKRSVKILTDYFPREIVTE